MNCRHSATYHYRIAIEVTASLEPPDANNIIIPKKISM